LSEVNAGHYGRKLQRKQAMQKREREKNAFEQSQQNWTKSRKQASTRKALKGHVWWTTKLPTQLFLYMFVLWQTQIMRKPTTKWGH